MKRTETEPFRTNRSSYGRANILKCIGIATLFTYSFQVDALQNMRALASRASASLAASYRTASLRVSQFVKSSSSFQSMVSKPVGTSAGRMGQSSWSGWNKAGSGKSSGNPWWNHSWFKKSSWMNWNASQVVPTLVGVGIVGAVGMRSVATTTACAQEKKTGAPKPALPPFMKENIKNHPERKQEFIDLAKQILPYVNGYFIQRLLDVYPDVAVELTHAAVQHFAQVDATVLITILQKNPAAAPEFARLALYTENPHLSTIFNTKYADLWWYNQPSGRWPLPWHTREVPSGRLKRLIIEIAVQGGQKISDDAYDIIHKHMDAYERLALEFIMKKK